MKKIILLLLILPIISINAQRIGEMAPEQPPEKFPANQFGADLMFSDGGFGLGTFYGRSINEYLTAFVDFSISETKDDREIEYIDYWGMPISINKKNRSLLAPLNFGLKQRIFSSTVTENLRPYISLAIGPSMVVTSPYVKNGERIEFFNSLKYAKAHFTVGGYIGFGADFGISKKSLAGLSVKYYTARFFNKGIENLTGKFRKTVGGIFLTIKIGMMY
ncbi:MAG: hypothetical protein JEY94_03715 [Melioribacteraceae bacterium]|nr:hypothetical protein [Melioribacteraceae bacterium]